MSHASVFPAGRSPRGISPLKHHSRESYNAVIDRLARTELSLAVGASIVGFNFGGNFALFPSATADLFGAKNLGANYGWVFTAYGIAGVVGIAAGNAAKTITGSYATAFVVAGCLCLISAALASALFVDRKGTLP